MNDIFSELINEGSVVVYLDDILIYSKNLEEYRQLVQQVFAILQENHLFLKPQKCEFKRSTTKYLGHIIGNGEIQMHLKKAKPIDEWPEPKNLKQLQQFTGFCNWYCWFIKDYSKIAKPLTQLTGNVPFTWGNEQREAMEELKR